MSKRKLQILPSTDEAVLAELEGPRRIPSVLSASAAQVNTIVTDDEESGVDTEDQQSGVDTEDEQSGVDATECKNKLDVQPQVRTREGSEQPGGRFGRQ